MAVRQIEVPARLTRRLSPASFVLAGVTVSLLWVAVTALLRQGSLGTVLSQAGPSWPLRSWWGWSS